MINTRVAGIYHCYDISTIIMQKFRRSIVLHLLPSCTSCVASRMCCPSQLPHSRSNRPCRSRSRFCHSHHPRLCPLGTIPLPILPPLPPPLLICPPQLAIHGLVRAVLTNFNGVAFRFLYVLNSEGGVQVPKGSDGGLQPAANHKQHLLRPPHTSVRVGVACFSSPSNKAPRAQMW